MLMRGPSNHTPKGPGRADRKGLTIIELLRKFPDDATAERWFEELRWKHRPTCPDCRSGNHGQCPSHPSMPYTCKDCRKRFSVRKGTIMQSSKLGYQTWAVAFYMAATNLKGISSMKLHRELGITQKTAWHLLQRIREVFRDGAAPLSGIVELDEVYLGGKERNKHASQQLKAGRGSVGKTAVVGAKQRGGKVVAKPVPATDAQTLGGFVEATVEPGSTVYTDGSSAYGKLREYTHNAVHHGAGEYVRGAIHTNSIEGFWSLFKRGYYGIYHRMTGKHLHRYLHEFSGRAGIRSLDTMEQLGHMVRHMDGKVLTYKRLTA